MQNDYSTKTESNQCHSYLIAQSKEQKPKRSRPPGPGPAVTISCQTGAGEHEIANRLAEILQAAEPRGAAPWRVFDRQLVEVVLKEHQLPENMAKFIPEDRRLFIEEEIDELLGLHPPAWVMVPLIAETVQRLAAAGKVILVGRGASFITARMTNVFHVRLVAPLPSRIERVQRVEKLPGKAAAKFIATNDRGRNRYAKAYFRRRADDDLLYHLVVNTDRIPCPTAARLIADQARICFQGGADGSK
jgi:hypothetical protein